MLNLCRICPIINSFLLCNYTFVSSTWKAIKWGILYCISYYAFPTRFGYVTTTDNPRYKLFDLYPTHFNGLHLVRKSLGMLALQAQKPRGDSSGALSLQRVCDVRPKMFLPLVDRKKEYKPRLSNEEDKSGAATTAASPTPRRRSGRSRSARAGSPSHGFAALLAPLSSPKRTCDKLHAFPPREVAEELAMRDAESLRRIRTVELENGVWMNKERVSRRQIKL